MVGKKHRHRAAGLSSGSTPLGRGWASGSPFLVRGGHGRVGQLRGPCGAAVLTPSPALTRLCCSPRLCDSTALPEARSEDRAPPRLPRGPSRQEGWVWLPDSPAGVRAPLAVAAAVKLPLAVQHRLEVAALEPGHQPVVGARLVPGEKRTDPRA